MEHNVRTETKQQKYFRQYSVLSLSFAVVGLVIMPWLGMFGIVTGVRALVYKSTAQHAMQRRYRTFAVAGLAIGILDSIVFLSR